MGEQESAKAHRAIAEHRATAEGQRLEDRLKQAAIPARFRGKTLDTLEPFDDIHRGYIEWARKYCQHFERVLDGGRNLALVGRSGTGKTHLACGIANELIRQRYSAAFTTVAGYFQALHRSYTDGNPYAEAMAGLDLLVLDEVGAYSQRDMDAMRSTLFELLNKRYAECKPTILISNLEQEGLIEYIGDRYERRLKENGGRVFAFNWDCYGAKS